MHRTRWAGLLAVVVMGACGGDAADEPDTMADTTAQQPAQPTPGTPAGGNVQLPAGVTQDMVAQGQALFSSGVCMACHSADGSGTALGPNLRDDTWLNTDGTYEGILEVIRTGVAQPREHPGSVMPPLGGGNFTDEQVRALGAYVYSISHGG